MLTDSKQTISNHMQAAVLIIPPQCPPPGIKHRFSWCMTCQPCVCTKVTLNTSTSPHTYDAYVAYAWWRVCHTRRQAVAHLWRMPGFSRTSITTLHWWWSCVDFSKLSQSIFVPHTNNLMPSIWLCSRHRIVHHIESFTGGCKAHACLYFTSATFLCLKVVHEICFYAIHLKLNRGYIPQKMN